MISDNSSILLLPFSELFAIIRHEVLLVVSCQKGAASAGQRQALAQACDFAARDGASPLSAWASALGGGFGSVLGDTNASTLTYNFGGAAAGIRRWTTRRGGMLVLRIEKAIPNGSDLNLKLNLALPRGMKAELSQGIGSLNTRQRLLVSSNTSLHKD